MADDKHEKALDLTEAALEALETGDDAKAEKLIEQAKKLDLSAVKEVVDDLAEAEQADGFPVANEDDEDKAGEKGR